MPIIQYFQQSVSASSLVPELVDNDYVTASSITLDGTGVADGAYLFVYKCHHGGVTSSTPAGWTLVDSHATAANSGGLRGYLYYKVASSESTTAFSTSGSADTCAFMVAVDGATGYSHVESYADGTTFNLSSVEVATGGCAVQMLGVLDDPFVGSITRPSGPTEIYYTPSITKEIAGVASYVNTEGTAGSYTYNQAYGRWVGYNINISG